MALVVFPLLDDALAFASVVGVISLKLSTWPRSFAYLVAALPSDIEGVGYGLVRTVYVTFGSSGAIVVGYLADSGLLAESFQLLADGTLTTAMIYSRCRLLRQSNRGMTSSPNSRTAAAFSLNDSVGIHIRTMTVNSPGTCSSNRLSLAATVSGSPTSAP